MFTLNIGLFDELKGNPARAVWAMAMDSLRAVLGLKKEAVA